MTMNPLDTKILLVGPGFVYQKTLSQMLQSLGFNNLEASRDGAYAWEAIKRTRPDIVISQWHMPEITGLALLKLIRSDESMNGVPVILCTEEVSKADVVNAGEAGVNAILMEPVQIENLEAKLRIILEFEMSPATRQAMALMTKGDLYLKQERYDEALHQYEKVLDILESAEVYYLSLIHI